MNYHQLYFLLPASEDALDFSPLCWSSVLRHPEALLTSHNFTLPSALRKTDLHKLGKLSSPCSETVFGQPTWHSPWYSNYSEPLTMWAHSSQQNSIKNILRQASDFHLHVLITLVGTLSGPKSESLGPKSDLVSLITT